MGGPNDRYEDKAERREQRKAKPGNRLIIEFADAATVQRFLVWLADGNGEQDFFQSEEMHGPKIAVRRMNYDRAFPAWGYDPEKHGPDRVVVAESDVQEEG